MRSILPIAGVILALLAAGCIGLLAREVIKEAEREDPEQDEKDGDT